MSSTDTVITISRDDFRQAVRRNIRSLLAMVEAEQQDLANETGMSASKLSERLTAKAGWRDEELANVARAFHVGIDAVIAMTVEDFHEALDGVTPALRNVQCRDQLQFDLAA